MPSCSAGPLNGADCPSTTVLSVMPSAQAARVEARQASGVLMSFAQYQQLSGEGLGFADRLEGWRTKYLASDMPSDDANPFDGVRQSDDARDFAW